MTITKAELETINRRRHEAVRILADENLQFAYRGRALKGGARRLRHAHRLADAALRETHRLREALARLADPQRGRRPERHVNLERDG